MSQEEYEHIKIIGQEVGYIFENCFNSLEDNYNLKKEIIDISKNYSVTHDLFFLRKQLENTNVNQDIKNKLYNSIQKINDLKKDKLVVYSNNIYIPDDNKFIEYSKNLFGSKPLAEIYHVPITVIASKTFELNKYGIVNI